MGKKSEKYIIQRLKKAEKLVDVLEAENRGLEDGKSAYIERFIEAPIAKEMRREYLRSCLLADGTEQHDEVLKHALACGGFGAFNVWVDEAICEWRHPDDMTGEQFKKAFKEEFMADLMNEYAARKRRFEERAAEDGE